MQIQFYFTDVKLIHHTYFTINPVQLIKIISLFNSSSIHYIVMFSWQPYSCYCKILKGNKAVAKIKINLIWSKSLHSLKKVKTKFAPWLMVPKIPTCISKSMQSRKKNCYNYTVQNLISMKILMRTHWKQLKGVPLSFLKTEWNIDFKIAGMY